MKTFADKKLSIQTILFNWNRSEGTSPVTGEANLKDCLVSVTPDGPVYRIFGQEMEEGYSSFFATIDGEILFELDVSRVSYRRAFQMALGTLRTFLAKTHYVETCKRRNRHGNA